MILPIKILSVLVALEFFYILYLETFATTSDTTARVFGMDKAELARPSVQTLFKNQGIYNGLIGVLVLLAALVFASKIAVMLLMGTIVLVALYGSLTSSPSILFKQGGLAIITLIAGVALSGVYSMTKETIDAHADQAKAAAYAAVVPGAASFEHDEDADAAIAALDGQVYGTKFGKAYVNEAFVAKDSSGNIVGYALSVTSGDGYDGNVTLSMGLDASGKLLGIAFTELTETPGMGMLADEPAFKDQFVNRQVTQFVHNKGGVSGDNVIDAISGASTTSGAVVNAVNAGLDFFHTVMGGN